MGVGDIRASSFQGEQTLAGSMHELVAAVRRRLKLRYEGKEGGATAVEYALMVGLIAVGIIAAVVTPRNKVSGTFDRVGNAVGGGTAAAAPLSGEAWCIATYGPGSYFHNTVFDGDHCHGSLGLVVPYSGA